jgi:hypothetical protein
MITCISERHESCRVNWSGFQLSKDLIYYFLRRAKSVIGPNAQEMYNV